MEERDLFSSVSKLLQKKPNSRIVVTVKARYPFATNLQCLDLSDCISILALNSFYANQIPKEHLDHFDLVCHFDAGEFWVGGTLSHLDALELPQLDQCIQKLIRAFKSADSNFDIARFRLAILEEQLVRSGAKIRQDHGMPGPKPADVDRFTDKSCIKQVAIEGGLDVAKYLMVTPRDLIEAKVKISDLERHVGYPMMFKPAHGVGAAGLEKIDNRQQLECWLSNNGDPNQLYIAEEYINGDEYHSVALIQASGIQPFPAPFRVYGHSIYQSIRHCLPMCTGIERDQKKRDIAHKFLLDTIRVFRPPLDTLIFVQGFMTADGSMKLSELACRAPGLVGSRMLSENSGISPEAALIMAQVGPVNLNQLGASDRKTPTFFGNVVYPKMAGTVKSIRSIPEGKLRSQVETACKVAVGEKTAAATNVGDIAVRIFLWNSDGDQLQKDMHWLRENFQPIEMNASQ